MAAPAMLAAEPGSTFDIVPLGLCRPHLVPRGTTLPGRTRYLVVFFNRHLDFRLAELQCLAEIAYGSSTADDGLSIVVWEPPYGCATAGPYWYVHVPEGERGQAALRGASARAMLVRAVLELWAEGTNWDEVRAELTRCGATAKAAHVTGDQSFKFVVETFGTHTYTMADKVSLIESFDECLHLQGKIDLKKPQHQWWAIECAVPDRPCLPRLPTRCYMGRQIDAAENGALRVHLVKYDLGQRRYIGPTSMDPELAYVMCALGGVKRSSLCFDPFAGTGSVLVAAADLGAHTLGMDIDARVIKYGKKDKKGIDVNIWTNFDDYGLPIPVGLLRADLHRPPWRPELSEILDAVVADPPYGVRAGARKSQANPDMVIPDRSNHIVHTAAYTLAECVRDLVETAARLLTVGGKLVYWIPASPDHYKEEELPRHPVLEFEANCEQILATRYSRRLVVMRKVAVYDAAQAEAHWAAEGPPRMALDEMRDYVYRESEGSEAEEGGGPGELVRPYARRFRTKLI